MTLAEWEAMENEEEIKGSVVEEQEEEVVVHADEVTCLVKTTFEHSKEQPPPPFQGPNYFISKGTERISASCPKWLN